MIRGRSFRSVARDAVCFALRTVPLLVVGLSMFASGRAATAADIVAVSNGAVAVATVPNAAMVVAAAPDPAAPLVVVHGSADAFAAPGVALAWGILRGRDESDTRVVVRIEAEPAVYGGLAIDGVDPFTRASQPLLAPKAIGGTLVVRLPRSRFAELPRTEWQFFAATSPRPGDAPALLVDYQGVPDTTPEFDDAARLDAYLIERVARARREAKAR